MIRHAQLAAVSLRWAIPKNGETMSFSSTSMFHRGSIETKGYSHSYEDNFIAINKNEEWCTHGFPIQTNVFDNITSKVQVLLELAADDINSSMVSCPHTGS